MTPLVMIVALISLMLPNRALGRRFASSVLPLGIRPRSVVARAVYVVLHVTPYGACLPLVLPSLLLHLRLPISANPVRAGATPLTIPPDQRRPLRPRRRPARLVQRPEEAGPAAVALVFVQGALPGELPDLRGLLYVVAVPGHAAEGGHGGRSAVRAACDPVGQAGFLGEG